jgi:aminoglycoside phosphotransferase (APT) family kinase protein
LRDAVRDPLVQVLTRFAGAERVELLSGREDGIVVRADGVVLKMHAEDADEGALRARLEVAACLGESLLPPLDRQLHALHGRWVSRWPSAEPLDPNGDPAAIPWEEAAALLAALHRLPEDTRGGALPPAGGPVRLATAVATLRAATDSAERRCVLAAYATLPPRLERPTPRCVVHGDFHLGQLVHDASGRLRLIDVDDLGVGDPAWDLARPAGWYLAGLLPPATWERFLDAYQRAGGVAFEPTENPWTALEIPARAVVIQSAARAVAKAQESTQDYGDGELALLAACERIAAHHGDPR